MVLTNANTRVTIIYPNLVYWYIELESDSIYRLLNNKQVR
jgi:hypothetical protein